MLLIGYAELSKIDKVHGLIRFSPVKITDISQLNTKINIIGANKSFLSSKVRKKQWTVTRLGSLSLSECHDTCHSEDSYK